MAIDHEQPDSGAELRAALADDAARALQDVGFPAYIVDNDRRVRWQNAASIRMFGDLRGRIDRSLVVPEDVPRVQEAFARMQLGAPQTDLEVTVMRDDGMHVRVAVSLVPLLGEGGRMIGSFGMSTILDEFEPTAKDHTPQLTARQRQTLALLADGYSTEQMADAMGLSKHTVRGHVKRLLHSLDARSRVEAVAKGRTANLISTSS